MCPHQPLNYCRNYPLGAWDAQTSPLRRQLELGESGLVSGVLGPSPLLPMSHLDEQSGAVDSRNASCQQPRCLSSSWLCLQPPALRLTEEVTLRVVD